MNQTDFTNCVYSYKKLKDNLIVDTFKRLYPNKKFDHFYIKDGRLVVVSNCLDEFDITNEIKKQIIPDDFVW